MPTAPPSPPPRRVRQGRQHASRLRWQQGCVWRGPWRRAASPRQRQRTRRQQCTRRHARRKDHGEQGPLQPPASRPKQQQRRGCCFRCRRRGSPRESERPGAIGQEREVFDRRVMKPRRKKLRARENVCLASLPRGRLLSARRERPRAPHGLRGGGGPRSRRQPQKGPERPKSPGRTSGRRPKGPLQCIWRGTGAFMVKCREPGVFCRKVRTDRQPQASADRTVRRGSLKPCLELVAN